MTNANLSANALFHFTGNLNSLKSIIKNGFYPRILREVSTPSVRYNYKPGAMFVPMVCFCDIPLSQIQAHIGTYGDYGIGINKDWGISQRITPVLYEHHASPTKDSFQQIVANSRGLHDELADHIFSLMSYFKSYQGFVGKSQELTCFYDEREWRFVPEIPFQDYYIDPTKACAPEEVEAINKLLEDKYSLKFGYSEVRYIVVRNNNDAHEMVEYIQELANGDLGKDSHMLITKIITREQIEQDF